MPFYSINTLGSRFENLKNAFALDEGLPFEQALTQNDIEQAAQSFQLDFAQGENHVYNPAVTLWAFLSQCLSSCKTCVAAVARVIVLRVALRQEPCSAATGAYCKARAKLPEEFLRHLTCHTAQRLEQQVPQHWLWDSRRVVLIDGTTVDAPDTPENQKAYPQPKSQKPGLGFPHIRLVALLGFATASILAAAWAPYQGKETGETALLRQLLRYLRPGDIVVADRYYCSYFLIALLQQQGVDVAFRLHHRRKYDFRRGQRLGKSDHLVRWDKPGCPAWMDKATYESMPDQLCIRELRFRHETPGSRSPEIIVATTLGDVKQYSKDHLADLYHQRWHVELDLRSLKSTMGLAHLSCQTPAMLHREIWTYLLGYNLIRKLLAEAALAHQKSPRQLSFSGGLPTLETFRWLLVCGVGTSSDRRVEVKILLLALSTHVVDTRPNRLEPRRVKRRKDKYKKLMETREESRRLLIEDPERDSRP